MHEDRTLGTRLRKEREMRRLTVAELAGRTDVSPRRVERLESGTQTAQPSLVLALAEALGLRPGALTGQPYYGEAETEDRVHAAVPELRRLTRFFDCPDDLATRPRSLSALISEVDQVSALRRDAGYASLGPLLIPLLTELTHVALGSGGAGQRRAFWHLARVYRAVNSLALKLGHHDLSRAALERVRWAAGRSGDPLLQITGAYLVAGAQLRHGSLGPARRKLLALREELQDTQPEHCYSATALALDGALLLKLAVLAARSRDADRASDYLREAEGVARIAGGSDSPAYEMGFGPTNVRIHTVHSLVDLGEAGRALARLREWGQTSGREWAPPPCTGGERSSRHHIDDRPAADEPPTHQRPDLLREVGRRQQHQLRATGNL